MVTAATSELENELQLEPDAGPGNTVTGVNSREVTAPRLIERSEVNKGRVGVGSNASMNTEQSSNLPTVNSGVVREASSSGMNDMGNNTSSHMLNEDQLKTLRLNQQISAAFNEYFNVTSHVSGLPCDSGNDSRVLKETQPNTTGLKSESITLTDSVAKVNATIDDPMDCTE